MKIRMNIRKDDFFIKINIIYTLYRLLKKAFIVKYFTIKFKRIFEKELNYIFFNID